MLHAQSRFTQTCEVDDGKLLTTVSGVKVKQCFKQS